MKTQELVKVVCSKVKQFFQSPKVLAYLPFCVKGSCLLLIALTLSSCLEMDDLVNEIRLTREQTLFSIDEAINSIQDAPSNWAPVLDDLSQNLTDEIQETIREDVQLVISRSHGEIASGVVCIMDAVPGRIIYSLETLRVKLVGGDFSVLPPTICTTSHNTINLNTKPEVRSEISFYGYDFDRRERFKFYLLKSNGDKLDLEENVAFQTDYKFTVALSSFSDNSLSKYRALVISFEEEEISRINIQRQTPTPPATREVRVPIPKFTYIPPHTRGDREFDGNGPKVRISCYIYPRSKYAFLRVYMKAEETKKDWTTAEGHSDRHYFYTAPSGWHIKEILTQTNYPGILEYTDTNHEEDLFYNTLGEFKIVGDTRGDEAGTKTKIDINFSHRVHILLEED